MGVLVGRRRQPPVVARGMTMPHVWSEARNFAGIDASGEGAFRSIAIASSVRLICSLASELPLHVYRGEGSSRRKLSTPSNLQDPAGDGYGLEDWAYQGIGSFLYRGNVFGDILAWDRGGKYATQIRWYHPDEVGASLDRESGRPVWTVNGRRVDRPESFFHARAFPTAGRLLGMSPIEVHALQPQVSIAAAQFGAQFFTDGAHPTVVLVNDAPIDAEQATVAKSRWRAMFTGSREPAVLGAGWKWEPIQVKPNESQFLETMRYSEAQCARIFGPAVPETLGYETGGSMTYANVVDRRSDLLTYSLNPWLRRFERILTGMLPEPHYARFDRDALLESTTLARYEAHARALQNRWKTVNEVRDDEDMSPVPWGDEPNDSSTPTPSAGGN